MKVAGTLPTNEKRVTKAEEKKADTEDDKAIDMTKAMEGMTAK
jgi:hypothetical protein